MARAVDCDCLRRQLDEVALVSAMYDVESPEELAAKVACAQEYLAATAHADGAALAAPPLLCFALQVVDCVPGLVDGAIVEDAAPLACWLRLSLPRGYPASALPHFHFDAPTALDKLERDEVLRRLTATLASSALSSVSLSSPACGSGDRAVEACDADARKRGGRPCRLCGTQLLKGERWSDHNKVCWKQATSEDAAPPFSTSPGAGTISCGGMECLLLLADAARSAVVELRRNAAEEALDDELNAAAAEAEARSWAETRLDAEIVLGRRAIYFHHVLGVEKRQCIARWSRQLRLNGWLKVGYPGVLLVEGPECGVVDFVAALQRLRWKLMVVRGEERIAAPNGVDAARVVPHQGVPEILSSSEIAASARACGLEELFLASMKIYR